MPGSITTDTMNSYKGISISKLFSSEFFTDGNREEKSGQQLEMGTLLDFTLVIRALGSNMSK